VKIQSPLPFSFLKIKISIWNPSFHWFNTHNSDKPKPNGLFITKARNNEEAKKKDKISWFPFFACPVKCIAHLTGVFS